MKMGHISLYRLDDMRKHLAGRDQKGEIEKLENLEAAAAEREEGLRTERNAQRAIAERLIAKLSIPDDLRERYRQVFESTSELTGEALARWIEDVSTYEALRPIIDEIEPRLHRKLRRATRATEIPLVVIAVLRKWFVEEEKTIDAFDEASTHRVLLELTPDVIQRVRAAINDLPYLDDGTKAAVLANPLLQLSLKDLFTLMRDTTYNAFRDLREILRTLTLAIEMAQPNKSPNDLLVRVEQIRELDLDRVEEGIISQIQKRNAREMPYHILDARDMVLCIVDVIASELAKFFKDHLITLLKQVFAVHPPFRRALTAALKTIMDDFIRAIDERPEDYSLGDRRIIRLPDEFPDPFDDLVARHEKAKPGQKQAIAGLAGERFYLWSVASHYDLSTLPHDFVYPMLRKYIRAELEYNLTRDRWLSPKIAFFRGSVDDTVRELTHCLSYILPGSYILPAVLQEKLRDDAKLWEELGTRVQPSIEQFFRFVRDNEEIFSEWAAFVNTNTPSQFWDRIVAVFHAKGFR